MFESALLEKLASDGDLVARLSSFKNGPAIFNSAAPEGVKNPYITFSIRRSDDHPSVDKFNVYVDFWDYNLSITNIIAASQRVEFLLDQKILQHARYDSIRMFRMSAGIVPETDTKEIHYNMQFSARAGRKAWMQQL